MKHQHYIDLTMDMNDALRKFNAESMPSFNSKLLGHVGTHMDIMDTTGPSIDRFISKVHFIDVSDIFEQDITIEEAKLEEVLIEPGDSVLFKTNWSEKMFETPEYFKKHPHLSYELVDYLLQKQVNFIGIDAPGIRRGKEHHAIDVHCANHNVFIVENLVNLRLIDTTVALTLYCFPLKFSKNTGVICRVMVAY